MKYKIIIFDTIRAIFKIRVLESLLVRLTQEKEVGSLIQKITPNNYSYKALSFREVTRNGIKYTLDIHDMVDWYIYYGFKNPCGSDMFELINYKDNVIDVGGNNGEVALLSAKKVGPKGRVISFEPLQYNIKRFKKNVFLNPDIKNITIVNKGVGDKEGEFIIANDRDDNLGMGWIEEGDLNSDSMHYTQNILVTTLDEYLFNINLSHIDFIKIDVEGFELKVLVGAEKVIKTFRPVLFIEVVESHLNRQNTSAIELIEFLQSKDYLVKNAGTKEVVDINTNFDNMMDVIAIPA